jgi:hypothetical protein
LLEHHRSQHRPSLTRRKNNFQLNFIPEYKFSQLVSLLREQGATMYCSSIRRDGTAGMMLEAGIGQVEDFEVVLKPELVQ